MSILRSILNFYLYSNLHIAICAVAILFFTEAVLTSDIDIVYGSFLLTGTLCLYAAHRLFGIKNIDERNITQRFSIIIKYNSHITTYAVLAAILTLIYFLKLELYQKYLSIIPIILSAAYILPILPNNKRLRDIPYIKIFLIAVCWSLFTCIIPLWTTIHSSVIAILAVERILFVVAITIPFDIRDQKIDNGQNVQTIATRLGTSNSQLLSITLLLISSFILLWCKYYSIISGFYFFPLIITYIISVLLITNADSEKEDTFFTGWIDGLLIIPLIIVMIMKYTL